MTRVPGEVRGVGATAAWLGRRLNRATSLASAGRDAALSHLPGHSPAMLQRDALECAWCPQHSFGALP
ncbi:hypothetical protein THIX_90395 [Thiomonas sp. X19]|nr:hypothetical protein THIX_90395 [Thiomonas sp. X19]